MGSLLISWEEEEEFGEGGVRATNVEFPTKRRIHRSLAACQPNPPPIHPPPAVLLLRSAPRSVWRGARGEGRGERLKERKNKKG